MTDLPSLGPRGEGWVLIQGVLLVLVAAAGWSLGPDWSGAVRVIGVLVGIALIASGLVLVARGVADLGSAMTPLPRPREHAELRQRDADLASRWRDAAAAALERCFGAGLIVGAFDRDRSAYALVPEGTP